MGKPQSTFSNPKFWYVVTAITVLLFTLMLVNKPKSQISNPNPSQASVEASGVAGMLCASLGLGILFTFIGMLVLSLVRRMRTPNEVDEANKH